jgi:hypothetical protein
MQKSYQHTYQQSYQHCTCRYQHKTRKLLTKLSTPLFITSLLLQNSLPIDVLLLNLLHHRGNLRRISSQVSKLCKENNSFQ